MVKPTRYIQQLQAYKITPQDVWVEGASTDLLKLDWNEAPFGFDWYVSALSKIVKDGRIVAWYPDYLAIELTQRLAEFCRTTVNNILVFPGSDVALETICRCYLEAGDVVVTVSPTYDNFAVFVKQIGASQKEITVQPPDQVSDDRVAKAIEKNNAKCVYLVSPNNPFGYVIESELVERLLIGFPETLFVIDEAYIEFSSSDSLVKLCRKFKNIIVVRTFSKAFGLAGVRLGYICADISLLNDINKIRNGKNISMIAQKLGCLALEEIDLLDRWVTEVRAARSNFMRWCAENSLMYFESEGNFVMFKVPEPARVCSELKARGIYVRDRDKIVPGFIRVTIGSIQNTEVLINALNVILRR